MYGGVGREGLTNCCWGGLGWGWVGGQAGAAAAAAAAAGNLILSYCSLVSSSSLWPGSQVTAA